ncbi:membrane-associated progesterone receptor component 1 [Drosophila virilis]|uniref:Cytochrome b5 heme-binding domain-containing protein n=1 Tax=Drosophila virilis TaxID=7244 RepID=B4MDK7_DROVI|nr:membrane steroid-binding protein 2 [Drosophila virilis]EDW71268.1 uncharacterized protein Dvir_GJ16155 [Drosophila virilis]
MAEENGLFGAVLIFGLIVVGYIFCHCYQKLKNRVCGENNARKDQKVAPELPPFPFTKMTEKQLLEYDGSRSDGRILIAFKGKIFDVSTGLEDFSPQGVLGCVAGRNFSEYLARTLQPRETKVDYMARWDKLLDKNYPMVGVLIDEEEQDNKGTENKEENEVNDKTEQEEQVQEEDQEEEENLVGIMDEPNDSTDVQLGDCPFDDEAEMSVIKVTETTEMLEDELPPILAAGLAEKSL